MANVVLPRVRMFIPCAGIELGPGKPCTIYSPLHTVRMPPGVSAKYVVDEIWFYAVLTDGVGAFRLSVEMRNDEDVIVKRSEPHVFDFKGGSQLEAVEFAVHMPRVPFNRPGVFEFRLLANHAHLAEGGTAIMRMLAG